MSAAATSAFDLDAINRELATATPEAVLAWTWKQFQPKVILTCSFQHDGVVLAHMLRDIAPEVPVVFINTGFHFPETLAYRDEIERRFGIKLLELQPIMPREQFAAEHGLDLYARNPDLCCHINKVEPLKRFLPGVRAWVNGRRRDQANTRKEIRCVEAFQGDLFKVNPMASWTSRRPSTHGSPRHPDASAVRSGLREHRLRAVHAPGRAGQDGCAAAGRAPAIAVRRSSSKND
jgi:phosphoadenosine phosphosulfate reductase